MSFSWIKTCPWALDLNITGGMLYAYTCPEYLRPQWRPCWRYTLWPAPFPHLFWHSHAERSLWKGNDCGITQIPTVLPYALSFFFSGAHVEEADGSSNCLRWKAKVPQIKLVDGRRRTRAEVFLYQKHTLNGSIPHTHSSSKSCPISQSLMENTCIPVELWLRSSLWPASANLKNGLDNRCLCVS